MKNIVAFCSTCLLVASAATAQTYTFQAITATNAVNTAAGEAQLRMTVSAVGTTQVNFRFFWEGTTAMSITQIYFDDENGGPGVLGTIASLTGFGGVDYSAGFGPLGPDDLPSGENVDFEASLRAAANAPVSPSGINRAYPDEYLDIVINLFGTNTLTDVITALNQGFVGPDNHGLRVGMHVQAIGAGGSESFVNNIVPLPPAAWAGLATLGGIAGLRSLRRHRLAN